MHRHLSLPTVAGGRIPCMGFGTYQLPARVPDTDDGSDESRVHPEDWSGDLCYEATRHALRVGFRLIDTAAGYRNESSVGAAIRDSGVPREELFIVVKVGPKAMSSEAEVVRSVRRSLRLLGLAYCDCAILHWPGLGGVDVSDEAAHRGARQRSWRALRGLRDSEKLTRFIGVSNFLPRHLEDIRVVDLELGGAPSVFLNQIELHPLCMQRDVVAYCEAHGIAVQQYGPLGGSGHGGRLRSHPRLLELVDPQGGGPFAAWTVADVLLLWGLVHGYCVVAKSLRPAHTEANWRVAQAYAAWVAGGAAPGRAAAAATGGDGAAGRSDLTATHVDALRRLRATMAADADPDVHLFWHSGAVA